MHHSLKLYSKYQEILLRYYIFQAKWSRLPLLGNLVRAAAEAYGRRLHNAYILTLEEADQLIEASNRLFLGACFCRKVFKNCHNPVNAEIVVGMGTKVFTGRRPGDYREISRQEARDILLACHDRGLLHTLVRCGGEFYAICNCCPCCCVPLRLRRNYRIANALVRAEDIVEVFQKSSTSS